MNESKKSILIVTHHFPPHVTGVGMVAYNQAKRLVASGYTVTVVTSETNADEKSAIVDGIRVIRIKALNFSEKWGAPFPIFSLRLLPVLRREVKKADVVHIHDAFYMSSFFAALFARLFKKPLVLTEHIALIKHPSRIVVLIEKFVYVTTGKIIFKFSNRIMVYNQSVKKFLIRRGVSDKKIVMLINGVNEKLFKPVSVEEKKILRKKFGLDSNKKVILFVGRFVPKKGFTKVLSAESSEYQIAFAGATPIQESSDNLVFLGKIQPSEMAEVYQAADIFILPSESEGFPLAIQEAMACGLPIITSDDEGYKDYKLDREMMYLIKNPTDESVQGAIREIVFDETRLQKMGEYSKQYVNEYFNWNAIISKLERVYSDAGQKPPKKLAFVSDAVYQFNKGGKEKRLYDLTIQLAKEGYDVTIYCMKWWKGPYTIQDQGVTLSAISSYYPLYIGNRRSLKQALFFSLSAFKLLTKSFDILDVDHIPHTVLLVTKFVCMLKRKKMIATWHEVWGKKYWREYLGFTFGSIAYFIEKISATLPDSIISVSDHTTAELKNILGIKNRVVTIPNALDLSFMKKILPSTQSDIIFAGRLLPHKNVGTLLHAIAEIKKDSPAIKAYIVGDGPQKEYLEKMSDSLNISDAVTFTGFLDKQEDVYALMKASKVFVLPSDREGFGITVIEANAIGLPVVTVNAKHNAAKDLIINNDNGMISDLNAEALADTIKKVLASRKPGEYYEHFSEPYSWEATISKLEELYV
ncbi:MAG TPA: glycosyltransferase family 4 protein [Candidatus Paceibacterota bacterium]|jgi:glycosyltransferase involved in cell wall biosynthesis|nr:glycosyltransferase family 4 protein [Candidatus Paceibacterota bacterium]